MKKLIISIIFSLLLSGCTIIKHTPREYKLLLQRDLLFLPVTFNGIKTKFLIDTGASKSILNIRKYEEYNFGYLNKPFMRYVGLGGIENLYIVFNYKIEYNEKDLFIKCVGADLGEIDKFLKNDGVSIIGILGSDFLLNHDVIIDYNKKTMYLKK